MVESRYSARWKPLLLPKKRAPNLMAYKVYQSGTFARAKCDMVAWLARFQKHIQKNT